MRHAKYKHLEAHIEEHRKLREHLGQLYEKHLLEEDPIYYEMMRFLKFWLIVHIQGADKQFGTDLQQAGFSVAEWEREASTAFTLTLNKKNQR